MQRQFGSETAEAFQDAASLGSHVYGYNASGQLVTDTWTVNGSVYVKTYTYNASGQLIGETDWVKQ